MTAATTTLNLATTNGDKMLTDTLTTVDGVAAPTDAEAQVTKMAWGVQSDAKMVTPDQPLPTSNNATIFRFSTGNTSTAQLAAGATFTGTIETALDQPSISLLLASDQPTTLTVRQFIDVGGTRAAPDVVFYIAAGAGFARSFTLNGNFVQVLAQNTGASTTTTFSLNTAYGDLGDADSTGTMPVTELPLVLTGQAAQTAIVNNILLPAAGAAPLNVSNFRAASVQVTSTGTAGTFIFEQSNDGTNWAALPVFNAALVTGVPITAAITATASSIVYSFPIRCTFLRLRIASTITGGSIQAFTRISSEPWTTPVQLVASNAAANMLAQVSGTVGVTGYPTAAASADGLANPTVTKVDATTLLFNGTTWDRARGNTAVSAEASSAKTTTGQGAALVNHNARGVQLVVNVSAATGTSPTLVVRAQAQDPVSSNWVDIPGAATVSITGTGQTLLTVYPGANPVANSVVSQPLGRNWRLAWVIGGTTPSFTFSVGAQYIL